MSEELLTVEQAADLLKTSTRSLYRLVEMGCPHLRLSGRRRAAIRFERERLLAYLADLARRQQGLP